MKFVINVDLLSIVPIFNSVKNTTSQKQFESFFHRPRLTTICLKK